LEAFGKYADEEMDAFRRRQAATARGGGGCHSRQCRGDAGMSLRRFRERLFQPIVTLCKGCVGEEGYRSRLERALKRQQGVLKALRSAMQAIPAEQLDARPPV
jgi:hypothetical protein